MVLARNRKETNSGFRIFAAVLTSLGISASGNEGCAAASVALLFSGPAPFAERHSTFESHSTAKQRKPLPCTAPPWLRLACLYGTTLAMTRDCPVRHHPGYDSRACPHTDSHTRANTTRFDPNAESRTAGVVMEKRSELTHDTRRFPKASVFLEKVPVFLLSFPNRVESQYSPGLDGSFSSHQLCEECDQPRMHHSLTAHMPTCKGPTI